MAILLVAVCAIIGVVMLAVVLVGPWIEDAGIQTVYHLAAVLSWLILAVVIYCRVSQTGMQCNTTSIIGWLCANVAYVVYLLYIIYGHGQKHARLEAWCNRVF